MLQGLTALVTGGAHNIGLEISRALANSGAKVLVNGIDFSDCLAACEVIRGEGGVAVAMSGDVSCFEDVERIFREAETKHGGVDLLVNNAALPTVGRRPFLSVARDEWRESSKVSIEGTLFCSQRAAAAMIEKKAGAIVNISSVGAHRAHQDAVIYDATKGAIEAATRAMALDLAKYQIRVNAVAPGAIENDRRAGLSKQERSRQAAEVPLRSIGTGRDVANAVLFLVSEMSSYITGATIAVDGGLLAQLRTPGGEL